MKRFLLKYTRQFSFLITTTLFNNYVLVALFFSQPRALRKTSATIAHNDQAVCDCLGSHERIFLPNLAKSGLQASQI
jgi:hypothetical protein